MWNFRPVRVRGRDVVRPQAVHGNHNKQGRGFFLRRRPAGHRKKAEQTENAPKPGCYLLWFHHGHLSFPLRLNLM
jgi:hypothetical protein